MKIILVNGQPSTGKTSIGKALVYSLDNTAFVDIDSLITVNPFVFNKKLFKLGIENTISLIKNFELAGYKNVVVSGSVKNQEELEQFESHFNKKIDLVFVWLRAKKEERIKRCFKRARIGEDNLEHFELTNTMIPDIKDLKLKTGEYLDIDTTHKTIEETVEEIKLKI